MKNIPRHAAAIAATAMMIVAGAAQGADTARSVPAFDAVTFGGAGTLEVTVGKPQSVVLVGDPELLRHVVTEVEGSNLRITYERNFRWDGAPLSARISLPRLAALGIDGSARTSVTGLAGGTTAFSLNGSGEMNAAGKLDTLTLAINGSGKAEFDKLAADAAAVTINGSGRILVQPKRSLASTINGSGEVRYLGSPQVTSQIHGSGTVLHE